MALPSGSSKNLLKQYHRLAEDTLLGGKSRNNIMVLEAAEDGRLDRLTGLLDTAPDCINARCPSSGDTPLIVAARAGNVEVIKLLLKHGADVTTQNDLDETALDVASDDIRKTILESIHHEDRSMSNAQALLQSAWLGDAVSLKRSLESGKNYLDVNCHNADGVTPVLLVTRDIALFDKIQDAMEMDYDPIATMHDLIKSNADLNFCDRKGRSAMHLVASSASVHAKKMASILLRNGAAGDLEDYDKYSPLHVASGEGHTAIIVALVEEGVVNVNARGGDSGATPLMLSARGGHDEAAKYLLSKGADVTAQDDSGNDALSITKSASMLGILKEAWVEQTKSDHSSSSLSSRSPSPFPSPSPSTSGDTSLAHSGADSGSSGRPSFERRGSSPPLLLDDVQNLLLGEPSISPQLAQEEMFFVTEGKITPHSHTGVDDVDFSPVPATSHTADGLLPTISPSSSEPVEADEELAEVQVKTSVKVEGNRDKGRVQPASKHAHSKGILTKKLSDKDLRQETTKKSSGRLKVSSDSEGQLNYSAHEKTPGRSKKKENESAKLQPARSRLVSRQVTGPRQSTLAPLKLGRLLSRSSECLQEGNGEGRGEGGTVTTAKSSSNLLDDKDRIVLPPVVPSSHNSSHTAQHSVMKTAAPQSKTNHYHLPALINMQPVAFMAVDTERENLKLHKYPKRHKNDTLLMGSAVIGGGVIASPKSARPVEKAKQSPAMQRSFSLNIRDAQGRLVDQVFGVRPKKRNSTGSVAVTNVRHHQESKVPLLPKVVTPQFGVGVMGSSAASPVKRAGPVPLGSVPHGTSPSGQAKVQGYSKAVKPVSLPLSPPEVSIAEEDTLTSSSHQLLTGTDSTLKATDCFDADSLEQPDARPSESDQDLPCNPNQHNLMVSYANLPTSVSASPIWNPRLLFQDDTQTGSDFITSPIGELDTLPEILLPGYRPGLDRKQGNQPTGSGTGRGPEAASHSRSGSNAEGSAHSRQGSDAETHSRQGSDAGWSSRRGSDAGWNTRRGSDAGWQIRRGSNAGWQSRRGSDAGTHHERHGSDADLWGPQRGSDAASGRVRNSQSGSSSSGEDLDESKDGFIMWKKGKLLGKGAYGKVWEGLLSSSQIVAVKEVELDTYNLERAKSQYSKIKAEVGILRSLRHRNIVRYLGTSMQEATVFIFMQYIAGGSIQGMLKRFGSLSYETVVKYTRQIASALYYLHGNGIIHRDVKGANVMVDPKGTIKLIDFGCAKNCEDSYAMHSVRGTPYWMAPEVICGEGYGKKSDIWSLGCTVQEMATSKPPWGDLVPEAAMFQIGMGKPIPKLPDHMVQELRDFIYFCLTRDQTERPGAADVLNHPFLQ